MLFVSLFSSILYQYSTIHSPLLAQPVHVAAIFFINCPLDLLVNAYLIYSHNNIIFQTMSSSTGEDTDGNWTFITLTGCF